MKMEKIIKRLHELQILILKANEKELDAIAVELCDIEKKIISMQKPIKKERR